MRMIRHLKHLCALTQLPVKDKLQNQLHIRANYSIRLYNASTKHESEGEVVVENETKTKKLKKAKTKVKSKTKDEEEKESASNEVEHKAKTDHSPTKNLKKNHIKSNIVFDSLTDVPGIEELKEQIPEKLLRRKRTSPDALYLINKDVAHELIIPILPYLRTEATINSNLIEINPGFGFLTELLLENWTKEISLFEHYFRDFKGPLTNLLENHRGRINLMQAHFFDLWRLAYQDKYDNGTRIKNLLNFDPKPWGPEFCTTMVGICPTLAFLKHMTHSLVFQHSLMMLGRHQMFFVVTPTQYVHLTCNREAGYRQYRNSAIMFQMLFDFKFLCKLPRKSFLPWIIPTPKIVRNRPPTLSEKFKEMDPDFLYLMRIESRANLFDMIKTEDMKYLWYFVKHNCLSRSNKIIPCLERWIPNCGPRLITNPIIKPRPARKAMIVDGISVALESGSLYNTDYYPNMTIFTEFGDLTPSQILTLFKQFRSWPEFSSSYFVASMENMLQKMEKFDGVFDDVDDDDEHEIMKEEVVFQDP